MKNVFFILMSYSYIPCGEIHLDIYVAVFFLKSECYFGHDKFIPWEMSSQYYTRVWKKTQPSGHFCNWFSMSNACCRIKKLILFCMSWQWQWHFSWNWIFHKKWWIFRFQWPLHVCTKGLFIEWIKFLENVFFMSLLIYSQSYILLKYDVWNFLSYIHH